MATIGFEALACILAGCIATWFHRENIRADSSEKLLEGQEGFRYTT